MPENTLSTTSGLIGRRMLLAGLTSLAATPTLARAATQPLLGYEARLQARLKDAGGGAFDLAMARQIMSLTNQVRAGSGAPACAWSDDLALTARAHAADLASRAYVEHVSPEGFDPSHRVSLLGRRMIGSASENIAYRRAGEPTDAADLMEIWRRSEPHWTNLLRPTHARVGFGVAVRGERTYAVGLYSRPDGDLGAPVPFRLGPETDLAGAISHASPRIDGFSVTDPIDESVPDLAAAEPVLPPGIYQLRPRRRLDARRYEILWGPIFVRV